MLITMLRQTGGGYSDEAGSILIFNDTTGDILKEIASHGQTRAFSTFKISSYPGNFLNAGQCIFAVDSTAGATWMGTDAPLSDIHESKKAHFETAVLPVPQYDTANISMISQGPSICIFNKDDNEEVLASWLFVQYMLSDDVQMAYSETEGYVPVTIKARNNPAYLDYLSREGEDNSLHYDVKIKAAKLLLGNSENTFVTPVFNGSTSLRDASGQMIEEVTKATRRRIEVDDAFIDKMYDNMKSLYRLDVTRSAAGNATSTEQSELPTESKSLLIILAVVWIFIAGYVLYTYSRNKSC